MTEAREVCAAADVPELPTSESAAGVEAADDELDEVLEAAEEELEEELGPEAPAPKAVSHRFPKSVRERLSICDCPESVAEAYSRRW